MTWRKIIPNLLTLTALALSFYSLVRSAEGQYLVAAQLIMVCLILDGLDGNLARLFRGTSKFGAELDTFVDITAYGLAPALLIYEVGLKNLGFWGHALVVFTVLSGAMRLSRFRVADPFRGQRGYCGLPITTNAGWVALAVFITESGLLKQPHLSLFDGPLAALVWTCSAVFLVLQVSNVRYGKPTKVPLLFVAGILFVIMLFFRIEIAVASAFALMGFGAFYAFISPFMPRHELAEEPETAEEKAAEAGGNS